MIFLRNKKRIRELNSALDSASARIAELEKQYKAMAAIIESMAEGVIAVGFDTKIISLNPAAEKIFGVTHAQAQGKFFLEIIRNNDIAEVIDKVLKSGTPVSQELALVWPIQKVFQVNASPISENNRTKGCSIVIHDITELRRLEVMRRDFVANVSHELKTPLTAINGFVETLLDGALEDRVHAADFLRIIRQHTGRLNNLVDDLLSLSGLEAKKIILDKKEVNIKRQLERIISGFSAQLKKKNIEFKDALPDSFLIKFDESKMEQVFINLIDNAIKFNKEGGFVRVYEQAAGEFIKIIIEDSGIGIPQKDIPRIFERFYRVDKARSCSSGGTGLGLSIVKHIIELHGGAVGVETSEGFGSKFWFTLPI